MHSTKKKKKGSARGAKREIDLRISELRRELAASREYLQSIIQELEAANEELQSANEEILSSNEELQSTNEELDTAKEELQSTNEELNTVNEELHSRNEELTRVNSDLTNLLGSVEIPIVIVGGDLRIRRFTPRAEQLFNLISGDVGRPIGQINPNFLIDDLERLVHETVDTITPREREVRDKSGKWLSLRVRPYKGVDNRLDGAVLSLIDIDVVKKYQTVVEASRDHFRAITDAVRQPMLVLDGDGRITSANRTFCDTFGVDVRQAVGRALPDVGNGQWDSSAVALVVEKARKAQNRVEESVEHHPSRGGAKRLLVTADPLRLPSGDTGMIVTLGEQP